LHPDVQAAVQAAIATATARRRDLVTGFHLLHALTREGRGAVADLLARYGASAAKVNAELERGL
jgi:ATP-dependent Clp protease ATP-binding subunit ClpA